MYFPVIVGPDCALRWFSLMTHEICKRNDIGGAKLKYSCIGDCYAFLMQKTDKNFVGAIYNSTTGHFEDVKFEGDSVTHGHKWKYQYGNELYLTDKEEDNLD